MNTGYRLVALKSGKLLAIPVADPEAAPPSAPGEGGAGKLPWEYPLGAPASVRGAAAGMFLPGGGPSLASSGAFLVPRFDSLPDAPRFLMGGADFGAAAFEDED